MKATTSRLKPKVINYRKYKTFDEQNFLSDIQQKHFECKSSDANENYENFEQKLLKIVNNHVLLKSETVRGNKDSFMNKNWRKAIDESTPLKTIYKKYRSRDAGTTTKKKKRKEIFVQI